MTVWPSGLRRWLQAPVRKGVGSNPTAVIFAQSLARSAVHSAVIYESARKPAASTWKRSKVVDKPNDEVVDLHALASKDNPATRNRTRDHLIAAGVYSQMLYQLSYSRLRCCEHALFWQPGLKTNRLGLGQDAMRSECAPWLC